MLSLWSALLMFASVPGLQISASPDVPFWVQQQWENDGPDLSRAFGSLMAHQPGHGSVTINATRPSAEPQRRDIVAYVEGARLAITLHGAGWDNPTTSARRELQQNFAHELAHVWHLSAYDSAFEPRWIHEGFAEALSLAALERADLWTSREVRAHRERLDATCAGVLEQSPLIDALQSSAREASYSCGFVIIEAIGNAMEKPSGTVFETYVNGRTSGKSLTRTLADATPTGYLGRLRRFIYTDFTDQDGTRIVAALRSGRL